MADTTWIRRIGLTPAKATAIGVLLIIFGIVVVVQLRDGSAHTPLVATPTTGPGEANRDSESSKDNTQQPLSSHNQPLARRESWPKLSVDEVVRYDPLQLPSRLGSTVATSSQNGAENADDFVARQKLTAELLEEKEQQRMTALAALQQQGVSLIITGKKSKAAAIGSQYLQVGDVIDGFVVKDIGPDGILLTDPNGQ